MLVVPRVDVGGVRGLGFLVYVDGDDLEASFFEGVADAARSFEQFQQTHFETWRDISFIRPENLSQAL